MARALFREGDKMKYEDFEKLLDKMIAEERAIGDTKGKEYTQGDRLDNFRRLAKELGADVVIDAAREDPLQKVIESTGTGRSFSGKGGGCADIVMECSGVPIALQQAIEMTRTGGRIVLVGLFEEEVPLNINRIVHKQLSLISSFNKGQKPVGEEIKAAIELLASGKVNAKPLISHRFPLDNIMEAFEIQTNPEQSIKVIIKP